MLFYPRAVHRRPGLGLCLANLAPQTDKAAVTKRDILFIGHAAGLYFYQKNKKSIGTWPTDFNKYPPA